jgi:EF-hand domain pair
MKTRPRLNSFCFSTVLRKAFESFDSQKTGSISTETVAEILRLMGQPFNRQILEEMIEEVDEDKSGRLEFEEFIILAAKFIVEEDEEARELIDSSLTQPTINTFSLPLSLFPTFQSRKS